MCADKRFPTYTKLFVSSVSYGCCMGDCTVHILLRCKQGKHIGITKKKDMRRSKVRQSKGNRKSNTNSIRLRTQPRACRVWIYSTTFSTTDNEQSTVQKHFCFGFNSFNKIANMHLLLFRQFRSDLLHFSHKI